MKTAGILLAAGKSQRFGPANKLLASFRNVPLVQHAANALRELDPTFLVAVTDEQLITNHLDDFQIVPPQREFSGQSGSLRAGIEVARIRGADRALILLADMPLVDTQLLRDVLKLSDNRQCSAATDGNRRSPPACFPQSQFADLLTLSGDKGARQLLGQIPADRLAKTTALQLHDVDTQDDLKLITS